MLNPLSLGRGAQVVSSEHRRSYSTCAPLGPGEHWSNTTRGIRRENQFYAISLSLRAKQTRNPKVL